MRRTGLAKVSDPPVEMEVRIHQVARQFGLGGRIVRPRELFAVWHRTDKVGADAPRLLFSSRMVGQCFIQERQWASGEP